MKITQNGPNTLHMDTYAGTGLTINDAIQDALKDYSPLDKPNTEIVVVIMKVITQVKEVINNGLH